MRFPNAAEAVASVAALMDEIERKGLPAAHAGIAAGPIVVRDGDVYGHTVNLAARIATHAAPGELLLSRDAAERLPANLRWEGAGVETLKGVDDPVALARVRRG